MASEESSEESYREKVRHWFDLGAGIMIVYSFPIMFTAIILFALWDIFSGPVDPVEAAFTTAPYVLASIGVVVGLAALAMLIGFSAEFWRKAGQRGDYR